MTSEVMDGGCPFPDTASAAITVRGGNKNEKESFQPVVRSVVFVLGFRMVGER